MANLAQLLTLPVLLALAGIWLGFFMKGGGKIKQVGYVLLGIGILTGALVPLGVNFAPLASGLGGAALISQEPTTQTIETIQTKVICPDTGRTAVTQNTLNSLNTSANDGIDVTTVWIGDNSKQVAIITDTTSPTATNYVCGDSFTGWGVSSTTVQGKFRTLASPIAANADVTSNDLLRMKPSGSDYSITVNGARQGTIQARAYDLDTGAFIFPDNGLQTQGSYVTFGNFTGSTNGSAKSISTSSPDLKYKFDFRPSADARDINDFGFWVWFDAATNKWDTPTVRVDGAVVTSSCDARTSEEKTAVDGVRQEYCYFVPSSRTVTSTNILPVEANFRSLGSIEIVEADSINVTALSRGAYRSAANSNIVKVGAYDDTSSKTIVIAKGEWLLQVR